MQPNEDLARWGEPPTNDAELVLSDLLADVLDQLRAVNENSCDLTFAERFISKLQLDALVPQLFVAYASCADAAVSVLHIPFAVWSCAMYVVLALLLAWTFRASTKSSRPGF